MDGEYIGDSEIVSGLNEAGDLAQMLRGFKVCSPLCCMHHNAMHSPTHGICFLVHFNLQSHLVAHTHTHTHSLTHTLTHTHMHTETYVYRRVSVVPRTRLRGVPLVPRK